LVFYGILWLPSYYSCPKFFVDVFFLLRRAGIRERARARPAVKQHPARAPPSSQSVEEKQERGEGVLDENKNSSKEKSKHGSRKKRGETRPTPCLCSIDFFSHPRTRSAIVVGVKAGGGEFFVLRAGFRWIPASLLKSTKTSSFTPLGNQTSVHPSVEPCSFGDVRFTRFLSNPKDWPQTQILKKVESRNK
jgi:hypothetical protein